MAGISKKLNKEQRAAVIFGDGPLMVVAGAGTGKTTVLTNRIIHLISVSPITFALSVKYLYKRSSKFMKAKVSMASNVSFKRTL